MSEAKNVLRNFIHDAWNERLPDACDKHLAEDYLHYLPGMPEPMVGPEGYRQLMAVFTAGFPDLRMNIEQIFSEGDKVCAVWTATGTHQGEFNGLAATGKEISLRGVAVGQVEAGKLKNVLSMFDNSDLARQLQD